MWFALSQSRTRLEEGAGGAEGGWAEREGGWEERGGVQTAKCTRRDLERLQATMQGQGWCVCVRTRVHLCVCVSVCQYLSACPSVRPSVCLSVCLSVGPGEISSDGAR